MRRGGKLRKAIIALPGTELVVADASQIECRILNEFAEQEDVVEKFRRGEDPYIGVASIVYGRDITKEDKAERGTGKQLELSCGYGAGDETIQKTARLGTYGPPVVIDLAEARRWKQIYRFTHPFVEQVWKEADGVIARMFNYQSFEWRCLDVECDPDFVHPNGTVGKRRVRLLGELPLIYDSLEWAIPSDEILARFPNLKPGWQVKTRKGFPTRMYGAKLIENVVQYMARMHLRTAMNEIRRHGIKIATTTHDELVAVVAVDKSAWAKDIMDRAMCTAPEWMPNLPLGVESAIVTCYGDGK
jgi:DNA polymerase I-like protein with 3'-5' exonuclease and polymerase domains